LSDLLIHYSLVHRKDNGRYLRFTTPSYADTLKANEALNTYAFPGRRNLGYLFAFESKRNDVMASIVEENGTRTVTLAPTRKRFEAMLEFKRQLRDLTVWRDLRRYRKVRPRVYELYVEVPRFDPNSGCQHSRGAVESMEPVCGERHSQRWDCKAIAVLPMKFSSNTLPRAQCRPMHYEKDLPLHFHPPLLCNTCVVLPI
jgi:hypothetical protein